MDHLAQLIELTAQLSSQYRPLFYRLHTESDKNKFSELLASGAVKFVHDQIHGQLKELVKGNFPSRRLSPDDYSFHIKNIIAEVPEREYGVWVFYPWNGTLVHILDKNEFISLRTNRNQYKITKEEQETLNSKTVGIIGLSVGQSIALTMATERCCGRLRLADFDELELSNLNRIRAGVKSLGLSKVVMAAREIAEMDPYIEVEVFTEGINSRNIDDFFSGSGGIDLLVEVCDGLDIKIESRYKARSLGIPVLMDTNDRGMFDVERFDLHPDLPVLHGLAEGLNPENIKSLSNEEKIPYILKMIGVENISARMKASMMEVEQSINTWPQLASSVVLGGAITTDVCRRIFLNQFHDSGRYYIDFDELIADKGDGFNKADKQETEDENPFSPLDEKALRTIVEDYEKPENDGDAKISEEVIERISHAASAAPSAGNTQPWKLVWSSHRLFVIHDQHRSFTWGDYKDMAPLLALGTLIENVYLQSLTEGLEAEINYFPIAAQPVLAAVVSFKAKDQTTVKGLTSEISRHILARSTNRKLGPVQELDKEIFTAIPDLISGFQQVSVHYTESQDDIQKLGHIIAECDKIRLLDKRGHEGFYKEIRWSKQDAEKTGDGIELASVDLSPAEIAGFNAGKDWNAMSLLAEWELGDGLKKMSVKTANAASAMLAINVPEINDRSMLEAGRALERLWIYFNYKGISVHPQMSPIFFFNRMLDGANEIFSPKQLHYLETNYSLFKESLHVQAAIPGRAVFLIKLAKVEDMGVPSVRRKMTDVFTTL